MKELSSILGVDVGDYTDENGTIDFVRWGKAIANEGKPAAIVTVKDGDFTRITATFSDKEIEEGMKAEAEENRILEETRSRLYGETE